MATRLMERGVGSVCGKARTAMRSVAAPIGTLIANNQRPAGNGKHRCRKARTQSCRDAYRDCVDSDGASQHALRIGKPRQCRTDTHDGRSPESLDDAHQTQSQQ